MDRYINVLNNDNNNIKIDDRVNYFTPAVGYNSVALFSLALFDGVAVWHTSGAQTFFQRHKLIVDN